MYFDHIAFPDSSQILPSPCPPNCMFTLSKRKNEQKKNENQNKQMKNINKHILKQNKKTTLKKMNT